MKHITKERIIKALDKNRQLCSEKPETHIGLRLATIGFRSQAESLLITQRDKLELAYEGYGDPEKILRRLSRWANVYCLTEPTSLMRAWCQACNHAMQLKCNRDKKILEIQVANNVSGLNEVEINLGTEVLKHHARNENLLLTDSDYEILHSERIEIAKAFVRTAQQSQMKLWRDASDNSNPDRWESASFEEIEPIAINSQWAEIWTRCYFLNVEELNQFGITCEKTKAESEADVFVREHNLSLGSARDMDTDMDAVYFSAQFPCF